MSNDKPRYKIGDELKSTLVIIDDDEDGLLHIEVKELIDAEDESISGWVSIEGLDEAFNPTVIERKRLERIAKLKKELEELENV